MKDRGNKGGSMRAFSRAPLAVMAMLALGSIVTSTACTQVGVVKARRSLKQANQEYAQQNYKKAAELYEETLAENPNEIAAYFYLGNSYDNQYKPSKKGDPANDALLDKAIQNYQLAAEKLNGSDNPENKKLGKLSLEYLVAAYGSDKKNDPAQAEPVLLRMIQMEPNEPSNYAVLAKIYEDAGAYPEAEQVLLKARDAKPNDPVVYSQLAGYYNRQGQFDKTIAAFEQRTKVEPNNPEGYFTIATYYWDETRNDPKLTDAEKREYIQKGLQNIDKALQLKADYIDALVYKGLLLRLEAPLEKDPAKQQDLLKQATALSDKANDLRKQKTAGTTN
jgi:tetratricopeptide (TPR) repeat protein